MLFYILWAKKYHNWAPQKVPASSASEFSTVVEVVRASGGYPNWGNAEIPSQNFSMRHGDLSTGLSINSIGIYIANMNIQDHPISDSKMNRFDTKPAFLGPRGDLFEGMELFVLYIKCSCLRIAADSSIHSRFWYFPQKYGMMSDESDNLRYKLPQADVLKDQTVHSFGGQSCWASILLVLAFGDGTVELRYLYCVNNRRVDVGMLKHTIFRTADSYFLGYQGIHVLRVIPSGKLT